MKIPHIGYCEKVKSAASASSYLGLCQAGAAPPVPPVESNDKHAKA